VTKLMDAKHGFMPNKLGYKRFQDRWRRFVDRGAQMHSPTVRPLSQNYAVNCPRKNYARFNSKFNGFRYQIC
jgi:hypothetical protein